MFQSSLPSPCRGVGLLSGGQAHGLAGMAAECAPEPRSVLPWCVSPRAWSRARSHVQRLYSWNWRCCSPTPTVQGLSLGSKQGKRPIPGAGASKAGQPHLLSLWGSALLGTSQPGDVSRAGGALGEATWQEGRCSGVTARKLTYPVRPAWLLPEGTHPPLSPITLGTAPPAGHVHAVTATPAALPGRGSQVHASSWSTRELVTLENK